MFRFYDAAGDASCIGGTLLLTDARSSDILEVARAWGLDFEAAWRNGQLEILGVVWETSNRRALVADPSGQAYIVREGDGIGKNDGMILSIDDNLMLVKETYVDFVGDKTRKEIEMRVRQGQGG